MISKNTFILLFSFLFLLPITAISEIKFFDNFESGGLSSTNADGFTWMSTGVVNDGSGTAFGGVYSLKTNYPAGENFREKRYRMGVGYQNIWVSYWIRVPTNYTHNSAISPANNKFGCLWMTNYGEASKSICWEMWPNGSSGSVLTANIAGVGHGSEYTQFISVPSDRGRWMNVVFNVKASTTSSSADGYIKTWRRWAGDSSFTQIHNRINLNLAYPNGWGNGYLMGYANAAYSQETNWYIDDFTISTTSLLDSSGSDNDPPTTPTNLVAQTVSESQINLSWTESDDNVSVNGYDIRRCSGAGCTPSSIVYSTFGSPFWSNSGLLSGTLYRYDVRAIDSSSNVSGFSSIAQATTQSIVDTTPPVLSGLVPAGDLPSRVTNVLLGVTTDEPASCRYGFIGDSWNAMIDFQNTNNTSHSTSIEVEYGAVYRYCFLCRDASLNTSDETCTRFSIPAAPKRPVLG